MELFRIILVFVVILFILISLYKDLIGPAFTFMIGVVVLGIFGILTPEEILAGFANKEIAIILMLLLIGESIRQTSLIEVIFDRIFKKAKSYNGFVARMMWIVGGFSAFLNNTPLVAVMMPYINTWCKRNNISPSKFLIPLSYAAILGGCATLIGTSTNLIVNSLVIDQNIIPGLGSINIFEFAWVGVPMMFIGFFYLYYFGDRLLPSHSSIMEEFSQSSRKYIVEVYVRKNSNYIGQRIIESGLKNLQGLRLVEMVRNNVRISVLYNDLVIREGDGFVFTGDSENIADILKSNSGLTIPSAGMMTRLKHSQVIEIVVSHNSTLISKTVREVNFRAKYDAAVLSVHRNGESIFGKFDNLKIKPGDVILLLTEPNFDEKVSDAQDFYLLSKTKDLAKTEGYKVAVLLGGTFAAIILAALKLVPLFMSLLILLVIITALKLISAKDLPRMLDFNLGLIIAMSLALGTAMVKTGVAEMISDLIIRLFLPLGTVGLLFGIYFITSILAAYITNKAAVAIIFPISMSAAATMNVNPMPFILVVSFAAAANFMTPIGYQTNLMVYGPGNYSFKDFFKIGFPLTLIYMVVTVAILRFVYF